MPCFCEVMSQAARNQVRSDVWVRSKMVPAVMEVCFSQLVHTDVPSAIVHRSVWPHRGHSKPSPHRKSSRNSRQSSSVANHSSSSARVRGKSSPGLKIVSKLTPYVRFSLHLTPQHFGGT